MSNVLRIAKGVLSPGRTIAQVRCIYKNMGDIFVYKAIDRLLGDVNVVSYSRNDSKFKALEQAVGMRRVARYSMLGGGTLIYAPRHAIWTSDFGRLLARTEPLCTFGTGVIDPVFLEQVYDAEGKKSPVDNDVVSEWMGYLEQVPLVGVRGVESARILRERGFARAEVIGDPAIIFAADEVRPKQRGKKVGVNILDASFFWPGSKEKALREMHRLLVALVADGWDVTLFPASYEDVEVAERERSHEDLAGRLKMFTGFMDVEAYIDAVSQMDVFVGMRLHSFVAACCSYTPAVTVGYQPKCLDFTRTVGLERFHIRTDEVTSDAVMELVREAYDGIEALQSEQFEKCLRMKERLTAFARRIKGRMGLAEN